MVVSGDGTWDVYETGDKWFECDEDDVDDELFAPVCGSRLVSFKFFMFLFLRWFDPPEFMIYSVEKKYFNFWSVKYSSQLTACAICGGLWDFARGSIRVFHAFWLTLSCLKI